MKDALTQFCLNIGRAQDLCGLASAIQSQTTSVIDVTDILRSALVLTASAFDHFVHEITRKGMLEIAAGKRTPTDAYLKFQVSLRRVTIAQLSSGWNWLDEEIRNRHGWLSFQEPEKLTDALRNVTAKKLWQEIGTHLGISSQDAKAQLKLIIDRRNKIAHEADMDPTAPGMRWPITIVIVQDAINFINTLAVAIVEILARP